MSRSCMYRICVLLCCLLASGASSALRAQMASVVNSLADDSLAFPYDDPNTEDVDESMDGICGDAAGRCTLRAALDEAAYRGEPASVTFSQSVFGALFIDSLQGPFFPPPGSVVKGYEQSVQIVGSGTYSFLMVLDSNTTVQGLGFADATEGIDVGGRGNLIGGDTPDLRNVFMNMKQAAVNLIGDNNRVQGNFIGLNALNNAEGNAFGVFVSNSSRNVIGGNEPGQGNVISGNATGIALVGDSTEGGLTLGGNAVLGNFIGTDSTGTEARPNQYGISVQFQHGLVIGDVGLGLGNVISGNSVAGIALGPNADTTQIRGNSIGTDPSGVYGIPNRTGVILGPGSRNSIVEGNVISSNQWEGVLISGYDLGDIPSVHHRLSGNTIVLNGTTGVLLTYAAKDNIIGSSLSQNFPPNTIQYNGQGSGAPGAGGVVAIGYAGNGIPRANTIRKNDFLDNAPGGIRFDQVAAIQDSIHPPAITLYTVYGDGTALVNGTHHRPGSLVDIYAAGAVAGPTFQGRQWLGSGTVDGSGEFAVAMDSCTCSRLIAIATDAAGNSSEFSVSFETRPGVLTADLNLSSGWNMVSVPVAAATMQTSSLFSGSTVGAYAYIAGSYTPQTTLSTGMGYWVRYPAPATVSLQGSPVAAETVAIAAGWNMIGSLSSPVAVSALTSVPGGLVTSNFYAYNLAYEIADSILPGRAYWVKANGSGSLILSSAGAGTPAGRITILPTAELPPLPPPGGTVSALPAPQAYRLEQNFPNPFNPVTEIRYALPGPVRVSLKVYDLLGREVATLVDGDQEAGYRSAVWRAQDAGSGIYLYELVAGAYREKKLMLLVR